MDLKELCLSRYSVRDYGSAPVEQSKLDYILECVRLAPSAVNYQPWKFYVVRSAEARAKLQQCYDRAWFAKAPVYIIACVDHQQEWVRKSDGKPHGDIDVAIAVEHLCLAAAEKGLGTCWVCNFDVERCRSLFSLPAHEEPSVLISLGYPLGLFTPGKSRKSLSEIVTEC